MGKVTEEFLDAVTDEGICTSCQVLCDWCGRTHFVDCAGHGDYETDELEDLLENEKNKPDKYVGHRSDDCIYYGYFTGKSLVFGCECNQSDALEKYEQFIWGHRFKIAKYLKTRSNREHDDVKANKELIDRNLS